MREVKGTDITIYELQDCYFGYVDGISADKTVTTIKIQNMCFSIIQDNKIIIFYPASPKLLYDDINCKVGYLYNDVDNLTVWDFITDFFDFPDVPEDYTFYFEG